MMFRPEGLIPKRMNQTLATNGLFSSEIATDTSCTEGKTTTCAASFMNSLDECHVNGHDNLILTSITAQQKSNQNKY